MNDTPFPLRVVMAITRGPRPGSPVQRRSSTASRDRGRQRDRPRHQSRAVRARDSGRRPPRSSQSLQAVDIHQNRRGWSAGDGRRRSAPPRSTLPAIRRRRSGRTRAGRAGIRAESARPPARQMPCPRLPVAKGCRRCGGWRVPGEHGVVLMERLEVGIRQAPHGPQRHVQRAGRVSLPQHEPIAGAEAWWKRTSSASRHDRLPPRCPTPRPKCIVSRRWRAARRRGSPAFAVQMHSVDSPREPHRSASMTARPGGHVSPSETQDLSTDVSRGDVRLS